MAVLRRTAQAEQDLIEIWLYIAQDDPVAADRLLDAIERKSRLLAENPALGPGRPDVAADFRYFPVGQYLLFYREQMGGIELVRVVSGARSLQGL